MMNYGNYWGNVGLGAGVFGGVLGFFLIPVMIWSLVWKGWALWKAVKNNSPVWFVILLVLNTLGILDILYIFVFGKGSQVKATATKSTRKRVK